MQELNKEKQHGSKPYDTKAIFEAIDTKADLAIDTKASLAIDTKANLAIDTKASLAIDTKASFEAINTKVALKHLRSGGKGPVPHFLCRNREHLRKPRLTSNDAGAMVRWSYGNVFG
jgi:hypothetical protein